MHIMSTAKLRLQISEKKNEIPKAGYDCCLDQTSIYLLKVNNGNTRGLRRICSKLAIKTNENGVTKVVWMSLLLTLNRSHAWLWCFHC